MNRIFTKTIDCGLSVSHCNYAGWTLELLEMKSPEEKGELGEAKRETAEVFVSSKALDVAKGWVRSMLGEGSDSDSDADDSKAVELESRPPRLGLGAKFLPHSHVAATMGPVERKLRAMTGGAGKQQQGKREGGERVGKHKFAISTTPAKESKADTESDDDEGEEVKGSSRILHGRQQRRIGSADLLMKTSGSKGKGSKRKR